MRKIYDRIVDLRGNLITVAAENVGLGELARIHKSNGTSTYASVLDFEDDLVTLQVFENTRGISTGDHVTFLGHQMQAIFSNALLGRRLNGAGMPIDDGPEVFGDAGRYRTAFFQSHAPDHSAGNGTDEYPDDRCLQLSRQIAENPDFFRCRRAL